MKLGLFGVLALVVGAVVALEGWTVMILAGILWSEFGWLAPIGFWPAVGLALLVPSVLVSFSWSLRGGTSSPRKDAVKTVTNRYNRYN